MYVKELTIRGFKSFANPTTLRFEPGITAIVGPNGSGKSNIVDALAWVMGEQGAKSLRGTSMEDVIFAGTSTRPPLGRAQVSLTIDNSDGTLGIEYSEVTISRTIYRNGGSEYAINGSPVRLLDVQELLSDTGLGSHMHVVVGQGRLDSILRATPEDNRAFIEEAAGILKHRKRKERALRKLRNTQDNLDRLDDLTKEIHRQLGPLRRQARVSRRADAIHVALRDAQSRLYADDAARLTAQRADVRDKLEEARARLDAQQKQLSDVRVRIEQLEQASSASSPKLRELSQRWHDLAQLGDRFDSLERLALERAAGFESRVQQPGGEDPDLLETRAREIDEQHAQREADVQTLKLRLENATERRADAEKQLAQVRQTLTQLRRAAQQREAQLAALRERAAREETLAQASAQRGADAEQQRNGFAAQLKQAQERVDALQRQSSDVQTDDTAAQLDRTRQAAQDARAARDAAAAEQRRLDGDVIGMQAQADALTEALAHSGAADHAGTGGAGATAGNSGASPARDDVRTLGMLADFVVVDDGWEDAIARAIGDFAKSCIVPTMDDASVLLRQAIQDQGGRNRPGMVAALVAGASDFPTSHAMSDDASDAQASQSQPIAGTRPAFTAVHPNAHASDTRTAQAVAQSVRYLLRGTLLVEDEAAAMAAWTVAVQAADAASDDAGAQNDGNPWIRLVTRDGRVMTCVGGYAGSSAPSDLALAARRDKAIARRDELIAERDAASARLAQAQERYDAARQAEDAAKAAATEHRIKAQEAARSLDAARNSRDSLARRIADLAQRIERFAEESAQHQQTLDALKADIAVIEAAGNAHAVTNNTSETGAAKDNTADASDLAVRETELEKALADHRDTEVAARMAWSEADRQCQSLQRQAQMLRDSAVQARTRRERIAQRNERLAANAQQAWGIAALARQAAHRIAAHAAAAQKERDELQAASSKHDSQIAELRATRNNLEPEVSRLRDAEHDLDITRERLASEYGAMEQKIADDLGLDMASIIRDYGPQVPVPVLDDDGRPMPLDDGGENSTENAGSAENSGGAGAPSDAGGSGAGSAHPDFSTMAELDLSTVKTVPYVRQEQEKRLAKAKRDLEALGKVNPLAGEEYDALEARSAYINEQRADVIQSRDDLLRLIKDLDTTMTDVFASAFADTAAAFEKVFAMLFPGGTGHLRLEDPDDMLSTGVIVEASPSGKRVKQLSLLSGGERSLTALALLFAIFTARPSPFYIMDEVEAALDDVNLTRLLHAIDDLRTHAQLIIITHQQRTMSIADALYGVTMRADGVTAVVSSKLDHTKPGGLESHRSEHGTSA